MNRNYMKIILPLGDTLCQKFQRATEYGDVHDFLGIPYRMAGFSVNNETNEATFELVKDKP